MLEDSTFPKRSGHRMRGDVCSGVLLALALTACAGDATTTKSQDGGGAGAAPVADAGPTGGGGDVEIFSWWTSLGEEQALEALIDVHVDRVPGASVTNAALEYADKAREELADRMAAARPPDTFQANIGADLIKSWVQTPGSGDSQSKVENLQRVAQQEGWLDVFAPEVIEAASFSGDLRAVPVNVHRINSMVIRLDLFEKYDLEVPTSVEELSELCARIAGDDDIQSEAPGGQRMACLGLGNKWNWTLSLLAFELLLPAMTGADYYDAFWMGDRSAEDAEFRAVLDQVLNLYCGGEPEPNCENHSYFNSDINDITWDQGVRKIVDKEAMMAPMGDWAKGFLEAEGLEPGEDFDVVPFPGTEGVFVFTSDTFPLPKGAPNRAGALELLKTFASLEGQVAFNRIKGSIPSRTDANPDLFDAVTQRTMDDFHGATKVLALSGLLAGDEMADMSAELKESMRRGSVEIITNYVRANYESIGEQ